MAVKRNFQATDSPSQQPATFESLPFLSYLTDEPEDEVDEPVPKAPERFHARPVPLPVALFGSHVEKKHANNNQPFMTEFEVSQNKSLHFKVSCVCL